MTGRAAPCKNSNAIPLLENRAGCYEAAKAKLKNPRCGQACHAKAQTDQGVSNSFRIVWPTTISQENTKPRRCTQKQKSMLATEHCTRFRRRNQLRKTSLKLWTSPSTPPVLLLSSSVLTTTSANFLTDTFIPCDDSCRRAHARRPATLRVSIIKDLDNNSPSGRSNCLRVIC